MLVKKLCEKINIKLSEQYQKSINKATKDSNSDDSCDSSKKANNSNCKQRPPCKTN